MIACICFCSLDFGANSWRPDDHKKNTRCECSQIKEWKTILKTLADDTGGRDVYVAIDCHVIWRSLINSLWSAPTCRNKASQHDHVNWGICNPSCCLLFVGMLYLICMVHDLSINKFNCTWKKFRTISIIIAIMYLFDEDILYHFLNSIVLSLLIITLFYLIINNMRRDSYMY